MKSTLAAGGGTAQRVPTYCYQCVAGPDLLTVKVVDGIATEVEPNFCAAGIHPAGGKVCVKAYGLVQKTNNPNRVLAPMKRTNPKKGRDEDPGFVEISWDEAMTLIVERLNRVRETGLLDESGYPRVAASFGGAGTPQSYMGTFPALLAAWGPLDMGFGSGQGVKCYHSEHLYGEFWHRAFIVTPDTPLCNYLISCGSNIEAAGGVTGVARHAEARVRGMKRVQVEPHLSVTGACSAEWVPIKPKTDPAFLFALIHVLLHEVARDRLDRAFLAKQTGSPYLVGPNGYYLRDRSSRKPLVFDQRSGAAVPFDTPGVDEALEGTFTADAIEIGPDDDVLGEGTLSGSTAFSRLVEHVREYSPEWAQRICDVAAKKIRQIANEFIDHACVGQTIEIDGLTLPYRPVAITMGKTVTNGWGGFECVWARTVLATLVGALEVPGGIIGTTVRLTRPMSHRHESVKPGPDGFMHFPLNTTSKASWSPKPNIRNAYRTMVPLAADGPWSQALGPTHFSWMFLDETPKGLPRVTLPEVWFVYRTNPSISFWDTQALGEKMARFPFMVAFAYTRDETNHFADVVLPDATDLESLQLWRVGGTKYQESYWDHQGFALRQPAVAPHGQARDFTDIATELAHRTGLSEKYYAAINKGAGGVPLKSEHGDFSLDLGGRARPRGDLGRGVPCGEHRGQRRRACPRARLVEGARALHEALPAPRVVPAADHAEAGPALRAAVPGAADARRHRARPPPARARHALVGHAAPRVPDAARVEGLPGGVGIRDRQGRRPSRGVPVLAADRAQHAVRVGREHGHPAHEGGRREHHRASRRHHQRECGGEARHCRRRPDRDLDAEAHGARACRRAPGHPTRHAARHRPVRSLDHAAREGLRHGEPELARHDVAGADRRHRLGRGYRAGAGRCRGESIMTRWVMVADLRRCVGCQTCTAACRHANATPPGVQWRRVLDIETGEYPDVHRVFLPVGCQHCDEPACMDVCPTTATRKRADGIVTIDYDLCIGCAYCAVACPYQARYKSERPTYAYAKPMEDEVLREDDRKRAVATKCTFCVDRIDAGLANGLKPGVDPEATPACVNACITADASLRRHRRSGEQRVEAPRRKPALPHARGASHRARLLLHLGQGGIRGARAGAQGGGHGSRRSERGGAMSTPRNPAHGIPYGPSPWQQTSWDWRAAGNLIGGGVGGGLIVVTALSRASGAAATMLLLLGIVFVGLGLGCVALEIGRPMRALNVFRNPRTSWMSREAIVATLLGAATLGAAAGVPGMRWIAALLALAFLYCQARLLQAARGIPAWREPMLVPWMIMTGLAEGAGVFWLTDIVHGAGVRSGLVLFAALLVARAMTWRAYRQRLAGKLAPPARTALDAAGRHLLHLGTYAPLVLVVIAFLLLPVPGMSPAITIVAAIAGALGAATGSRTKLVIVTRAGFNQGFRVAEMPVRGARP